MISPNHPVYYISPTFDRIVLLINKKLLEESQIQLDDWNLTWEELRELTQQLKTADSTLTGYEIEGTTNWNKLLTEIAELNGISTRGEKGRISWSPELKTIAKEMVDDVSNGILRQGDSSARNWSQLAFFIGKASNIHTLLADPATASSWVLASIPHSLQPSFYNPYIRTTNIALSENSDKKEQAWELIEYLLSEKAVPDLTNISPTKSFYWQEFVGFPTHLSKVELGNISLDVLMPDASAIMPDVSATMPEAPANRGGEILDPMKASLFAQEVDKQFTSVRNRSIPFEQAWDAIQSLIEDINADPANFITIPG
ncbi:carbohydrate ABC transporter substrate-binding protein [Paenibacillus sp. 1011MAR3C5]|nr:carbohydrate ABC transporter substrate-binding protein [Paenibacillus sp. 1011MAR3C5]